MSSSSTYLRQQAAILRQWARTCFDLSTARQLNLKAAEFDEQADSLADEPQGYLRRGDAHNGGSMDRD
jgi:hypothetical protein